MSDLIEMVSVDGEMPKTISPPDYTNSNLRDITKMEGLSEAQTKFYLEIMRYFDGDMVEVNRLTRYIEYWKMFRGEHWNNDEEEEDVPTPVYNKIKSVINKGISFLVGKSFTVHYINSEIENLLNPYVQYIIDNSGGPLLLGLEMAQMGFVTGDCFIKPIFKKGTGVKLQICDSKDIGVKYYHVDYDNNVPNVAQTRWKYLDEKDYKKKEYREIWTNDFKAVFINQVYQPKSSGKNLLGVVPIVHIRNALQGKTTYGFSDVDGIETLNLLLNYALRRFMNMVDYNADPITVLFGARISELEKGDNKLWGNLPKDAKVQNLTNDSDFPALQKFIEYISTAIHEIASVTETSVQGLKHVSNTSGTAMYMNNLPLLELTDRKKAVYKQGLENAIKMALELILVVGNKNNVLGRQGNIPPGLEEVKNKILDILAKLKKNEDKIKPWNWIEVRYKDYMPKDRLTEMQMIKDEMSLGLESREGAMKRLGKENVDELLKQIDKDIEFYVRQSEASNAPTKDTVSGDVTEGMTVGTKLNKQEKKGDAVDQPGD